MTDAQISEAFVTDLVTGAPDARISEVFMAAITTGAATGAQISEAFVASLCYEGECATERADVWFIERQDGTIFAFTSLDAPITWRGVTFVPCSSLQDTASESSTEVGGVGSVELVGLLSDDSITDADIYSGLFDDAYVECWQVAYGPARDLMSPVRLAAGWIGKITRGQTTWTAEVLGPAARLQQTGLVQFFTPGCRWQFGSPQCSVNATALTSPPITVTSVLGRYAVHFTATEPVETAIWQQGKLKWLTGKNAGITCQFEIMDWTGIVSLWDLAPYLPAAGDTFEVTPGCPKDKNSCIVYDNLINFGGFPDVPGPDSLQQNADSLFTGSNG